MADTHPSQIPAGMIIPLLQTRPVHPILQINWGEYRSPTTGERVGTNWEHLDVTVIRTLGSVPPNRVHYNVGVFDVVNLRLEAQVRLETVAVDVTAHILLRLTDTPQLYVDTSTMRPLVWDAVLQLLQVRAAMLGGA